MSVPAIRVNDANPDPRIAVALLLDTSSSMGFLPTGSSDDGAGRPPIEAMNDGFQQFVAEILLDDLAKKRTEVAVITFGGQARVEIPFTEGRDLTPRRFTAGGGTPLGAALDLALDELTAQKSAYKASGLEYYRPWLFIITDGAPTDWEQFTPAAQRVKAAEKAKGVSVFGVLVGDQADEASLAQLSDERVPVRLDGLKFTPLFKWLSASMNAVSHSNDPVSSDESASAQIPLPSPKGWMTT